MLLSMMLCASVPAPADAIDVPVVRVVAGAVSGAYVTEEGVRVAVFRGIPYAAPPVGALRWRPPQAVVPWRGKRASTQDGPWCVQNAPTGDWMGGIPATMMSEDCLYLNVFAPAAARARKLPVIVWLHPGGLDAGSGNQALWNITTALPRHGVVLVNVNVRLGALGYLAHPSLTAESAHRASGNYGMLDAIAALQWVHDNIDAFGGDSRRVTIAGQSGGAQKVMWVLASPLARGLIQRAIVDAGVGYRDDHLLTASGDVWQQKEAEQQGTELAKALDAMSIDQLREVPWPKLVAMLPKPQETNAFKMHFVVDSWSMPATPFDVMRAGARNDVPVLMGAGAGERTVLAGMAAWGPGLAKARSNVYVYVFSHVPGAWKAAGVSAYHGLDLPYVFGNLASLFHDHGTLVAPSYPADPGLDGDDTAVSETMMRMWAHFAAMGDPNVSPGVTWPAFHPVAGHDYYLEVDATPRVRDSFMATYTDVDAH
jgi:para-nitrobenzyl esterase